MAIILIHGLLFNSKPMSEYLGYTLYDYNYHVQPTSLEVTAKVQLMYWINTKQVLANKHWYN